MGYCFLEEHLWFDCTNLATELSCNGTLLYSRCSMHVALCILHNVLHIALCTLDYKHCSIEIVLCPLQYAYCTKHIALFTLHLAHCTLHIELCTLHYAHWICVDCKRKLLHFELRNLPNLNFKKSFKPLFQKSLKSYIKKSINHVLQICWYWKQTIKARVINKVFSVLNDLSQGRTNPF